MAEPLVTWTLAPTIELPVPAGFYLTCGKRIFDTVLIVATIPLWLPVYLLIASVNLLMENPPVHYRCTRLGRGGREFSLRKFRTMSRDADAVLPSLLNACPVSTHEFTLYQKMKKDPRVTRVGKILRRLSLDELPQVWNVLRGEMSLVGPRPVTAAEWVGNYGPAAQCVFSVRPGMTGLWQVSGRSLLQYEERISLDLNYVKTCSLRGDLVILFRSISAVTKGRGAF